MKKIRVGIIGAGKIVEDIHLPILNNIAQVEVRWLADMNTARSKLLSTMYGVHWIPLENVAASLTDTDACLIATPWAVREPYLKICAQTEVAVYVEKPFAKTRTEHERYCSWFPGHRIAAGFQRRFYKVAHILKRTVESGVFGGLKRVEFTQGQYSLNSSALYQDIANTQRGGSGALFESGVHGLDQILFVTAAHSVETQEVEAVGFDNADYEIALSSVIHAGDGAHSIQVRCQVTRLRNVNQGFKYFFDNAMVAIGMDPDSVISVKSSTREEREFRNSENAWGTTSRWACTVNQAFYLFWHAFLDGVEKQEINETSATTNRLTTAWIEDIYQRVDLDKDRFGWRK